MIPEKLKARGAGSNAASRFERVHAEAVDEEWMAWEEEEWKPPAVKTEFFRDPSRSILARNTSPDISFDVSVNPYRGCEHGCVYCFARPSHEYLGLSAGLDFETRIFVKTDAAPLLRAALAKPSWKPCIIAMSGVTDPYQPVERRLKITRACLEVLAEFRNPVVIITKNALVRRDIDLLQQLATHGAARVCVSLTTLDTNLARVMEPRTAMPAQRLRAIAALREAGVPVGVIVGPVIPGLNDSEIPKLLQAAKEAGADHAGYVLLRLPHGLRDLFSEWLETHYPLKKEKVLNRLRSMRGGELYQSDWGKRMVGEGFHAEQLQTIFTAWQTKLGLHRKELLNLTAFRRPTAQYDLL